MRLSHFVAISVLAIGMGAAAAADDVPQSGPAANGSPAWFIYQAPPATGGGGGGRAARGYAAICRDDGTKFCSGKADQALRTCLSANKVKVSASCQAALAQPFFGGGYDLSKTPACAHSPSCSPRAENNPSGLSNGVGGYERVEWKSDPVNMGYRAVYPYAIPPGGGGATSVSIDSKGNLWTFQRNPPGMPSLFKFGPDHKLLLSLGDKELGSHQDKAHGIKVDAEDNIWICDASGATVKKISASGKLLLTLGVHGHPGDWNEAKGQRYLWQPLAVAFARDGTVYIAEGHANESPNDIGGADPTNRSGAARILHLTKDGKFIAQWYGNVTGQGKFMQAHDVAIDPRNGDVWIGDREQYRLVVYNAAGRFLKTVQMRNLICNVAFDAAGNLWVGTGTDGQLLQIDRNGKVLGAVGNGPGRGEGQTGETGYIAWDKAGNMYTGSTGQDRITMWTRTKS